jgi:hypothetical protein
VFRIFFIVLIADAERGDSFLKVESGEREREAGGKGRGRRRGDRVELNLEGLAHLQDRRSRKRDIVRD